MSNRAEVIQEAKDILYMAEQMRANRGGSLDVYLTARVLNILAELTRSLPAATAAPDGVREALEAVADFMRKDVQSGDNALWTPEYEALHDQVIAALAAAPERLTGEARPAAFLRWARETFGAVALLRSERLLRFIEEAMELAHAEGMERTVFNKVADRVYSRPAGDTPKEIGQAQACLETFAENIGLSSDAEAQREWDRVQMIPRAEWERRHSAKQAIGIALSSTQLKEGGK